jgi:hypothetical protein
MMLMGITKMLAELYAERDRLDEAIRTFVRLQTGQGKRRRGGPPKWLAEPKAESDVPSRATRSRQRSTK